jgi:peptide deformylase
MTVRDIVKLPDKRLKRPSQPVKYIDANIRALVSDMLDTMYDAPGIGLAAIQIGVELRVVVVDVSKDRDASERRVLINPEITWTSMEKTTREEGCLSIPEQYEDIERPERVRVKFRDLKETVQEIEAEDLLAACLQHEVDHTNGILFIDHLSKLKRDLFLKRYKKFINKHADTKKRKMEA